MVTGDSKALKPELTLANSPTNLAFVPDRPAGFVVINSDGVDDFPGGDGSEDIDAYLFESTQFYQDISVSSGKHDMKFGMNMLLWTNRWTNGINDPNFSVRLLFSGGRATSYMIS